MNSSSSVCKSPSDTKSYKVTRLKNGMQVLLAMDGDLDAGGGGDEDRGKSLPTLADDPAFKSCQTLTELQVDSAVACAICVRAGTFNDPDDINGLAHFLEHMVFLGSAKYPQENAFDVYLKESGGFSNAVTSQEFQTYYFACTARNLLKALDIFANFFISPLFRKDMIAREVKAIDSEFQLNANNDQSRLDQMLAGTAVPNNPARKFIWGNSETLHDNISTDKLHRALLDFHHKYYTADRMTLCILSRIPLSTLESCAVEIFSKIRPSYDESTMMTSSLSFPYFEQKTFNRLFYINPIKDINQLTFFWQMPSTRNEYRSKPDAYLGYLFEHESEGSLFSYLKRKLWAVSIWAGVDSNGFCKNSLYTLFQVQLALTEDGLRHVDQVTNSVFSYVRFVKEQGPRREVFDEIKRLYDVRFKFQDEIAMDAFVTQSTENMHRYAESDILCGPFLISEYKPNQIINLLSYMVPENVAIVTQSQSLKEPVIKMNFVEPWYKTLYSTQAISTALLNKWHSVEPLKVFRFPAKNTFIPNLPKILPFHGKESKLPELIKVDPSAEYWYKRDTSFKLPTSFVNLHLISPIGLTSPKNLTMMDLYTDYLSHVLNEKTYAAALAKVYHEQYVTDRGGLVVRVFGFSQKVPALVGMIARTMRIQSNVKDDVFEMLKREYGKRMRNALHYRNVVAEQLLLSVIQTPYHNVSTRCKVLAAITKQEFVEFLNRFFDNLYVQSLSQGNLTKNRSVRIVENFLKILRVQSIPKKALPQVRVRKLPLGQKTVMLKSYDKSDQNSLISLYYQWGPTDISQYVVLDFMSVLMGEPLFTQLRTKDQLGYDVSGNLDEKYGVVGLNLTVQWSSDKYQPAYVENRIKNFMNDFRKNLEKFSKDEFERIKNATIRTKNCIHDNLYSEVRQHWAEILNQEYLFDRNTREMEKLAQVELVDIENAMRKFLADGGSKLQQLTVLVLGGRLAETVGQAKQSCELDVINITDDRGRRDNYITNIEKFRKNLPIFPSSKVIK